MTLTNLAPPTFTAWRLSLEDYLLGGSSGVNKLTEVDRIEVKL